MEGFEGFDLEVNSIADFRVPMSDESSVEEGAVNVQHVVGSVARSFWQSELWLLW